MDLKNICFELADAIGTSGDEYNAAQVAEKYLKKYFIKGDIPASPARMSGQAPPSAS